MQLQRIWQRQLRLVLSQAQARVLSVVARQVLRVLTSRWTSSNPADIFHTIA
jgi:hypothetical protein